MLPAVINISLTLDGRYASKTYKGNNLELTVKISYF